VSLSRTRDTVIPAMPHVAHVRGSLHGGSSKIFECTVAQRRESPLRNLVSVSLGQSRSCSCVSKSADRLPSIKATTTIASAVSDPCQDIREDGSPKLELGRMGTSDSRQVVSSTCACREQMTSAGGPLCYYRSVGSFETLKIGPCLVSEEHECWQRSTRLSRLGRTKADPDRYSQE
jgi:hypothetical protein